MPTIAEKTMAFGYRFFLNFSLQRNEKGETPLHRACIEGNVRQVKRLIEQVNECLFSSKFDPIYVCLIKNVL